MVRVTPSITSFSPSTDRLAYLISARCPVSAVMPCSAMSRAVLTRGDLEFVGLRAPPAPAPCWHSAKPGITNKAANNKIAANENFFMAPSK